jgi:phosphoribosyl-ATP pyrophosphohydrolase/phosphoribosyl-AMP cyclohydrolase
MVDEILTDCDDDTLLIKATPLGPTCHTGSTSCFHEETAKGFVYDLEKVIEQRITENPEGSYTSRLFSRGVNKVAQKVGEEAVELVIEAKDDNLDLFRNEAADLLYHYLILLKTKNLKLEDIEAVLKGRHK